MAYEEEKKKFVEAKKAEEKKKMIIMIATGASGLLLMMIGSWIGGVAAILLLILGILVLGLGGYFVKVYLDARKWRIHYEQKPPEDFRPKTPEERAETERALKEMEKKQYEKTDANGALDGFAFDNFVRHHCTELGLKKYYGLDINIYPVQDQIKGSIKLDVKVKGTLSYCAPLQETLHNSSDAYMKEMDYLQEKYGSETGRHISYNNGLFDSWSGACHNDTARNLVEAKKGIKRYVAKYYLKPILDHANKFNGINYYGKVFNVIDVAWDILLDDPSYYTDKSLKKLNQDTRH